MEPEGRGAGKLLSPTRRRQAVEHARERHGVSERRACRLLRQARSTQRYRPSLPDDETRLVTRMVELALRYRRDGTRRIAAWLRREGWEANHKRVERLWRRDGLKVPRRQLKRGRLWLNDGSSVRMASVRCPNVW